MVPSVSLNTAWVETLGRDEDIKGYRFTATAGQTFQLSLRGLPTSQVRVIDGATNESIPVFTMSDPYSEIIWTAPRDGEQLILAYDFDGFAVDFTMALTDGDRQLGHVSNRRVLGIGTTGSFCA